MSVNQSIIFCLFSRMREFQELRNGSEVGGARTIHSAHFFLCNAIGLMLNFAEVGWATRSRIDVARVLRLGGQMSTYFNLLPVKN